MTTSIILFEDQAVAALHPISLGKPAYATTCGSFRLVDWIQTVDCPARGIVRGYLSDIQRHDFPQLTTTLKQDSGDSLLLVNSRLVPSVETFAHLDSLLQDARPFVARVDDSIAMARLPAKIAPPADNVTSEQFDSYLAAADLHDLRSVPSELQLFRYPHDVVRHHLEIMPSNVQDRLAKGSYREIADGVFAAEGAEMGQFVVSDTRDGPILLDEGASVGPYCYLSGPAYLGPRARVIEHAAIKDGVSIGHTTKIGGEVEASIIEPYTNKQHHGFLGHSYLGSWINLGAGTCNSDLKNTYGKVNMEYGGKKVSTDMQFIGTIMGDYAKSAINTGVFTGKTVGACSMIYGFVTTNVPSFVNYARLFGQITELPPEVMIATQRRMFARRNVQQRPCDTQLLFDMYELSRCERQLGGERLSL